ncbi:floral homeotic protein HUA1 [Prunus dulcis]|uniref:Floral homeotic protein HUA1 n=1 Tax=Prunus dulcis TaxID=3755 RepID=A0A4Y1RSW3_PRUDU|nr:floral homeotic protein HUA1 [Prunus dulcis]
MGPATAGISSVYTSRALTDSYLSDLTLQYLSESDPSASATDDHSRTLDVEPGVKRPSEGSDCRFQFHLNMWQCKFGATCKFHHPKDILIPSAEQENTFGETGTTIQPEGTGFAVKPPVSFIPALSFNSKGLPVRPGEPDFACMGPLGHDLREQKKALWDDLVSASTTHSAPSAIPPLVRRRPRREVCNSLDPKSDQCLSIFGERLGVIKGFDHIMSPGTKLGPPHGASR